MRCKMRRNYATASSVCLRRVRGSRKGLKINAVIEMVNETYLLNITIAARYGGKIFSSIAMID